MALPPATEAVAWLGHLLFVTDEGLRFVTVPRYRRYSQAQRDEAIRLHEEAGIIVPEIAKRLHAAQTTVYRWLREHLRVDPPESGPQ